MLTSYDQDTTELLVLHWWEDRGSADESLHCEAKFEVKDGDRFTLPNGVVVTVRRTDVPGLVWELRGPGGWGHWAIDLAGKIVTVGPITRKQPALWLTAWCAADLVPAGEDALAALLVGSVSGSR